MPAASSNDDTHFSGNGGALPCNDMWLDKFQ